MKKLILLFVLTLLPLLASAYDAKINGIYYNFSGNEARVTYQRYYNSDYSGNIVIPELVTYKGKSYSVTTIETCAFSACKGLSSVTIPNSVTNILGGAFDRCTSLTHIEIPKSVTTIDSSTFRECI